MRPVAYNPNENITRSSYVNRTSYASNPSRSSYASNVSRATTTYSVPIKYAPSVNRDSISYSRPISELYRAKGVIRTPTKDTVSQVLPSRPRDISSTLPSPTPSTNLPLFKTTPPTVNVPKAPNISNFTAPIPSSYIRDSGKPFLAIFRLSDLDDINTFKSKIEAILPINTSYIAFIKLRYFSDSFCMCGKQFAFDYKNQEQIACLLEIVISRIANSFEVYNMSNDNIVYIQLSFRKLDIKLLTDFKLDKSSIVNDKMTSKEVSLITSTSNVPVSTSESSLGRPLKIDFVDNLITFIYVTINNETFNLLDNIKRQAKFLPPKHSDNISSFDSSYKFYLLYIKTKYYVIALKFIDNNKVIKISYFLNGVLDKFVTDTLLSDNTVSRLHGNIEFLIDNSNVVYSKHALAIRPINKPKVTHIPGEDSNIGVIDFETFKDTDDKVKVYAGGFKTNLAKDPVMYYLENGISSEALIIKLVNELFRSVYNDTTFYCHNFGRYD